jgi:8-hydroxy-5-deazaflavin:NADPH oxidoreductase
MSCRTSILGSGNIGAALARRFAAKDMSVGIANRQSPDKLDALVRELGPRVMPQRVPDALRSDIIILAIPFGSVPDATRNFIHTWSGKIVVDATNPHTVAEIRGKSSTADVAACVPGAAVVKAFNTLPAAVLAADPQTGVGRRVLFLSSYDADAAAAVSTLIQGLGFAPIPLGNPDQGGLLQQRGGVLFLAQFVAEDTPSTASAQNLGLSGPKSTSAL